MKKSKFTESQIVAILKQQEAGLSINDLCREHGISQATFFNWKKKFSVIDSGTLKRLKELEAENTRLKRMYADVSLQRDALKDLIEKKL